MPGVRVRVVPMVEGQNRTTSMTFTRTATVAGSSPASAGNSHRRMSLPNDLRREPRRHKTPDRVKTGQEAQRQVIDCKDLVHSALLFGRDTGIQRTLDYA